MSASARSVGSDALVLVGIALGLVVAVIVERTLVQGMVDRPVIIAAVTAVVALLWLVVVRLFFGPPLARAAVPKRDGS
jgi:hypothetical protein